MAFESQNKLISSFNTDNVRQGLFRYQGDTSITKLQNVGSGYTNLSTQQDGNASLAYKQANDLINTLVKGATQIKTVQNEEDELRQSIDASRELSLAYQTMQVKKEEALTAVDKQRVIDDFRNDVYSWSTQLTDKNRNAIESTTHNFLNFEAREQARIVRQENLTELKHTMNTSSSVLLSMKEDERNNTINAMRSSFNNLGFTDDEFNEVAYSTLANNLFAGITKDNISREALYTIENTANSFLKSFNGLEGSKAYNDTKRSIESLRGSLVDRDVAYVNRAIQLGDVGTFNHYNEALFKNGDITDIDYKQNRLAFNQKMAQQSRTPIATYESFKQTLADRGVNVEDLSIDTIKQSKLVTSDLVQKLELARTNNIYKELLNPDTDIIKLGATANKDPKLFDKAIKNYADTNKNVANQLIANIYEIKDPTSEAYLTNQSQLNNIIENTNRLINNPRFIGFVSDNNEAVKNLNYLKELSVVANSMSLSQADKIDYMYKNNVDRVNKTEVDSKEASKVKKAIKDTLTKEYGITSYNKNIDDIDILVNDKLSKGLPQTDIVKLAKDVYKVNKLNKNISADKQTQLSLFGKVNQDNIDRIDEYLLSDNYSNMAHTMRTSKLQDSFNRGEINEEVYKQRLTDITDDTNKKIALFQDNLRKMKAKAIDEDKPLSIEYDNTLKLVVITNGDDILPTNLNIKDPASFVQSFEDFSGVSYQQGLIDNDMIDEVFRD